MANEIEITISWENDNFFKMTAKHDAGEVKTVVNIDENTQIYDAWPHVEAICKNYLVKELEAIGIVMKG